MSEKLTIFIISVHYIIIHTLQIFLTYHFFSSPPKLASISLNGCHGKIKGNFLKTFKSLLSARHTGDKSETLHTCSGRKPLYKCTFSVVAHVFLLSFHILILI